MRKVCWRHLRQCMRLFIIHVDPRVLDPCCCISGLFASRLTLKVEQQSHPNLGQIGLTRRPCQHIFLAKLGILDLSTQLFGEWVSDAEI